MWNLKNQTSNILIDTVNKLMVEECRAGDAVGVEKMKGDKSTDF